MLKNKILLMCLVASLLLATFGCNKQDDFDKSKNKTTGYYAPDSKNSIKKFCPSTSEIIKQDGVWVTRDLKWKNFGSTTATKILNFTGAQWVGVTVGKIICLYQTNEAVSFPLALEQIHAEPVFEPFGGGWSALAKKHKFCKSANIVDCSFLAEKLEETDDIYKEITTYNPKKYQE